MTALAAVQQNSVRIGRINPSLPVLFSDARGELAIRAGTVVDLGDQVRAFETETPVTLSEMVSGRDYGVAIGADGSPYAAIVDANPLAAEWFAGFHYAPASCAKARDGGTAIPEINPFSLWDIDFRPACPDPRGMALVVTAGGSRFWSDIYLLGVEHLKHGTSRCGARIADGHDLPERPDGNGKVKKLDYATAVEIFAGHGKRLLGAEEFFAAAYGVKERCSRDDEPAETGELVDGAERFVSKWGIFDVTGTMWQWGTDGDPDAPRPSLFGGSWFVGGSAGSRYAHLGHWADPSSDIIGCRGACDHK